MDIWSIALQLARLEMETKTEILHLDETLRYSLLLGESMPDKRLQHVVLLLSCLRIGRKTLRHHSLRDSMKDC